MISEYIGNKFLRAGLKAVEKIVLPVSPFVVQVSGDSDEGLRTGFFQYLAFNVIIGLLSIIISISAPTIVIRAEPELRIRSHIEGS